MRVCPFVQGQRMWHIGYQHECVILSVHPDREYPDRFNTFRSGSHMILVVFDGKDHDDIVLWHHLREID